MGYWAGLEERPEQFVADPLALCLWVLALALDASLRAPLPTHWFGATFQHHEPLPRSAPDLTEEGLLVIALRSGTPRSVENCQTLF
ncbi:MAG TPA: hypothetical protein VHZ51_15815 [Ktedonobacteraceae bacterium]|nr:hypothetical protein [Ktedonobacteraceae bacterium]